MTSFDGAEAGAIAGAGISGYVEEKFSAVRKAIARTMCASLSASAQLTHHSSFNAARILACRERIKGNAAAPELAGATLNDMILYMVSRVIKSHRAMNAHILDDRLRYFDAVNLGFAVDTKRGLLVPTIRDAEKKGLAAISAEARELAQAAQTGRIDAEKLKHGTFTVSNLGTLGVEQFTPVINPPQTAILGVGCVVWRIGESAGQFLPYPSMGLSLTYDHRAVDGAPAARFVLELTKALEAFELPAS
jgi:pyruvate dehydrogenase E2 component (dihydrolipoamide acetyltransferase)